MINITNAQRELLTHAAAAPEGDIATPEDEKTRRALIKKGLAISLPVEGGGSRLIITDAGRAAVVENEGTVTETATGPAAPLDDTAPAETGDGTPIEAEAGTSAASGQDEPGLAADGGVEPVAAKTMPGGKLGTLVELLKRPSGATLEEMVTATGWQVHSVRGAMSGSLKKKLGLTIDSSKTDGTRAYRIVTMTAEQA